MVREERHHTVTVLQLISARSSVRSEDRWIMQC
jgi:hypothetical protein